jgi:hypothetical protein
MYSYTLYDKLSNPSVKHVQGTRFGSIRRETCMILLDNLPPPHPLLLPTVSGTRPTVPGTQQLLHALSHLLHALGQLLHALGNLLHM